MKIAISRRSFIAAIPLAIGALAALGGCGEDSNAEPLDLTGTWVSIADNSEVSMTAIIEDDEITIYWGDDLSNIFSVFWAGSYKAPNKSTDSWSWKSKKDDDRYGYALAASDADTIEFTYKNGVITFEASLYGLTQIAELQRLSNATSVTVVEEAKEENELEETETENSESIQVFWTVNGIDSSIKLSGDNGDWLNLFTVVQVAMESTIYIVKEGRALEYSEYFHSGYTPSDLHASTSGGIASIDCTIDGIPVQFEVPTDIDYNELAAMVVDITLDALRQAGEY